ncbi:OLC1v1005118C1 [Oldenlandia corymbosa var. corymbosa]|uniref:OLC1v1005118C1 n=1 Tax=Oldenlandia corymbosa var. corymbosa TaxID=529605 RepID=A0AAV1DDX3_OLDCO|nr:OLC1v1005118C1 [Oldenlandia corymbosa var. corymbosa]
MLRCTFQQLSPPAADHLFLNFTSNKQQYGLHLHYFYYWPANQLDFVDSVLEKMKKVLIQEIEPIENRQRVQTIHDKLDCCRSFLRDVEELHRQQQDELQALWDRVFKVTNNVNTLVGQLLSADQSDSSSELIASILEDILSTEPDIEVKRFELRRKDKKLKVKEVTRSGSHLSSSPFPFTAKGEVVGFVNDERSIKDQFTGGSMHLRIVAIVGMVGLGRRYLIFLDDIWDVEAWYSLAGSFPDDKNGSRILITSRHRSVAPQHLLAQGPHSLRPLNKEESLELLQMKLFLRNDSWTPALSDFATQIAKYCKGLPLTIVIVAGLLKTTEPEGWEKIRDDLSSGHASVIEHCMNTLEHSDEHLPDHLKHFLLYFGAFPEDKEISAERLLHLWIAEGFVQKAEGNRIEDAAQSYLKVCSATCFWDSIGIRIFCDSIGIEDILIQCQFIHLAKSWNWSQIQLGFQILCSYSLVISFKLLRVPDLEHVDICCRLPSEIESLFQLAFLAIKGKICSNLSSITILSNLEILILVPSEEVSLTDSLWNLQKLKYLQIWYPYGILPVKDLDDALILYELDRLCGVVIPSLDSMERLMRKFPNIRRFKCRLFVHVENHIVRDKIVFPDSLSQLQTLSMKSNRPLVPPITFELFLPKHLKKLSSLKFVLSWRNISTIGQLPNLQVLKLLSIHFEGDTWEMEEGDDT